MRSRLFRHIVAIILFLCILSFMVFQPKAPTLSLTISTESIPTLLPHAHGAADKVSDAHHGVEATSLTVEIQETMWVTEIAINTTNAPRDTIHHLQLIRILPDGTRDFLQSSVLTVGQDTVPVVRFPSPSGILFHKGEQVAIDAILHNPVPPLGEGGIYKDVTIDVRLSGVRNGEGRYLPLQFDLPRVTDSIDPDDDDSTFVVPIGTEPFTRSSKENPEGALGTVHYFTSDGWIVYMGAHMHPWEGGTQVDAYLNDKRVRSLTSQLLDRSIPWSYLTEAMPALIKVKRGDTFSVSTTYINTNNVPIEGAMGMIGIYYVNDQFFLRPPLYAISWTVWGWFQTIKDAVTASFR